MPRRREGKCACKGFYLERFVQPAVLLAVYQAPQHGFSILKQLSGASIVPTAGEQPLDPTGLYRMLKRMEEGGLLSSFQQHTDAGIRKVYGITPQGRECLRSWYTTLRGYRDGIDELMRRILDTVGMENTL